MIISCVLFIFILLKGVLLFSPDFISLTLPSVFQESANSFGTNYISEDQTWSFVINFKVFHEYGRSGWNLYNTLQKLWGKSFIFHVATDIKINDDWLDFSKFYLYVLHVLHCLKAQAVKRNCVCIMRFLFPIIWHEINCKKMIAIKKS